MSKIEKYNQSKTQIVKRSMLRQAPYNPKHHSKEQIAEIKRNFKKVGFLGGIIWNENTGNLVDGHKRLAALDTIHNYKGYTQSDYDVKVEVVNLDEKTEKEQNIFQTKSRTDLDNELLADLLPDIDIANTGLTDEDLRVIEIVVPNFEFTTPDIDSENIRIEKKSAEDIKKIKDAKKNTKHQTQAAPYVTITFDTFENKAYFMERFGFDQYDEFIKGERFEKMIERVD